MPHPISRTVLTATVFILFSASAAYAQALTVQTIAGAPTGAVDLPGAQALFNGPNALARDAAGNIYVADSKNHTIRKVTPAGFVSTLAGAAGIFGFADGTTASAQFALPMGIAIGSNGNIYVANFGSSTIRKITPQGVVTTIAGSALSIPGSQDGNGQAARFNGPVSLCVDSTDNIFVADTFNHIIRKITPAGDVTTIAGKAGVSGSANGKESARFNNPFGIAVAPSGNLFVSDSSNNIIRKVAPDGTVSALAGTPGVQTYKDGTGAAAAFSGPQGLTVDASENIYLADGGTGTIRKITPAGVVTTVAGVPFKAGDLDGPGSTAMFNFPSSVILDAQGNLLVSDYANNAIRKITPANVVSTLAGPTGAAALLNPKDVSIGPDGSIYFTDFGRSVIRKIATDGTVSIIAGQIGLTSYADFPQPSALNNPFGLAVDGNGVVFFTDQSNAMVRYVLPDGKVFSIAGTPGKRGTKDGTADKALFNKPAGITFDSVGNLYVADTASHTIRKIASDGTVSTFAGKAGSPGSTDGSLKVARFNLPVGITFDFFGNLLIADSGNHAVRGIDPNGQVFTVAGAPDRRGSLDGPFATASFDSPVGLGPTPTGVYVSDSRTNTIRLIANGTVTTVAGNSQAVGSDDGTGISANLISPGGLARATDGTLYIADSFNSLIRIAKPGLTDSATIDRFFSRTSQARQFDVANKSATTFKWRVLTRPAGSVADFSNTNIANPTFTPDVAGPYKFELLASSSAGIAISRLPLLVLSTAVLADFLASNDNPGFINGEVRFFTHAISAAPGTLTYQLNFGDGTPTVSATFPDNTVAPATHTYTVPGQYTVTFTVSDGANPVSTSTLVETIPSPNSGAFGILNKFTNKDTVTNPVNGFTLDINASNGGVIQAQTNVADAPGSPFLIKTDFGTLLGRTDAVLNARPVAKFTNKGVFVATTRVSDAKTGAPVGMARKMIVISAKETGTQPAGLGDAPDNVLTPVGIKGSFFFNADRTDTVTFTGSIKLPPNFDPFAPHDLSFGIGNIITDTALDAKGRGTSAGTPAVLKSLKVLYKGVKRGKLAVGGEEARISAQVSLGGLVALGFDTEGITNQSTDATPGGKSVPRMIQVALLLEGTPYQALVPVNFTVSRGSDFGSFQGRR